MTSTSMNDARVTAADVIYFSKYFKESEFPMDTLAYIDPQIITTLNNLRHIYSAPIHPSPVREAWIRFDGSTTSRHYVGNGRLADAADFFPGGSIQMCWLAAQSIPEIGGIGLYPYTRHGNLNPGGYSPMMHIDLRPYKGSIRVFWLRRKDGSYIYPQKNNAEKEDFFREFIKLQ